MTAQPQTQSLDDAVGGEPTFHRIVARFYELVAVDENGQPLVHAVDAPADLPPENAAFTDPVTASILRINHYATRSEEEFRRKATRWKADTGKPPVREIPVERVLRNFDRKHDDTILTYLPALRDAMQDARQPA